MAKAATVPTETVPETVPTETAPTEAVTRREFRRVKAVTRPVLKLVENYSVFVQVEDAIYLGEKVDEKKDPAHLMHVINLETGEQMLIVAPKGVVDGLTKNYPDNAYVGKTFEICVRALKKSAGGNNFRPVDLFEIEA